MTLSTLPLAREARLSQPYRIPRTVRTPGPPLSVTVAGAGLAAGPRRPLRPGDSWIVGSAPDADLLVPSACARHCQLRHDGDAVELVDLDSATGVRIAGARVRWAELPLRAAFEIGTATVCLLPATSDAPLLPGLVGRSPAMRDVAQLCISFARTGWPVLLRGETGTGKELVARAIHGASPRAARPFVPINGATVTGALGLSLLFGHVAGAYTGAQGERRGAFREADGGTLFIDEVASLPPEAQAALLRVIEDTAVVPVGADRGSPCDVRILAATCEPLEERVERGAFRDDLYQRLSACVVAIPPLRQRTGDLPLIAEHVLSTSELCGCRIDPAALALLEADPLPGNVRELRNLLIDAGLRCRGRLIAHFDVAAALRARRPRAPAVDPARARDLLARTGGNVSAAARTAGMPRSTFRDLLQREVGSYGLGSY